MKILVMGNSSHLVRLAVLWMGCSTVSIRKVYKGGCVIPSGYKGKRILKLDTPLYLYPRGAWGSLSCGKAPPWGALGAGRSVGRKCLF